MDKSRIQEFTLHFGANGVDESKINSYQFDEFGSELFGFLLADAETNKVYLISFLDEEFITSDIEMGFIFINSILDRVDKSGGWAKDIDLALYFQVYNSFEDAYEVAKDMKETNELCYNN